eukprot:TRINITY_DN20985_c0_g1_i1.p1 TRINITY_DN20985_c0_g1~~TRINITY_DN20985_c0_g1_i1.p1  ORF type:complete len:219 (+),score=75.93 TRINITY_DN20985_c0_g1_i1:74-658(+)
MMAERGKRCCGPAVIGTAVLCAAGAACGLLWRAGGLGAGGSQPLPQPLPRLPADGDCVELTLSFFRNRLQCEGYWDMHLGVVPFEDGVKWCGQTAWLQKFEALERAVRRARDEAPEGQRYGPGSRYAIITMRGLATSHIDDSFLGNEEFTDSIEEICWTGDLREHYYGKYNVRPTRRMYEYVMDMSHQYPDEIR